MSAFSIHDHFSNRDPICPQRSQPHLPSSIATPIALNNRDSVHLLLPRPRLPFSIAITSPISNHNLVSLLRSWVSLLWSWPRLSSIVASGTPRLSAPSGIHHNSSVNNRSFPGNYHLSDAIHFHLCCNFDGTVLSLLKFYWSFVFLFSILFFNSISIYFQFSIASAIVYSSN